MRSARVLEDFIRFVWKELEVPQCTKEEMKWLAPRIMICSLSQDVNRRDTLVKELKKGGVARLEFDEDVYKFWAAHQIIHTLWEPDTDPKKTVSELLKLFELVPEVAVRKDCCSEREFDLFELVIGARNIYRRHLAHLLEMRRTIEADLNKCFA